MGLKGRIAIHEVLVCGDEIQSLISASIDTLALRQAALERGMTLMTADGLDKVGQGLVHLEDVLWRTGNAVL